MPSASRWYDAESDNAWGDAKPSLNETRVHAKCLRSVNSVRDYFREYRAKKKHVSMCAMQARVLLDNLQPPEVYTGSTGGCKLHILRRNSGVLFWMLCCASLRVVIVTVADGAHGSAGSCRQ